MVMYWLGRFWGYVALVLAAGVWAAVIAASVTAPALAALILVLSAGAAAYFLFQFPVQCRAETWAGPCRSSSSGLLLGCRLDHHRWQPLSLLVRPRAWPDLRARLLVDARSKAGLLAALGSAVSGLAALLLPVLAH